MKYNKLLPNKRGAVRDANVAVLGGGPAGTATALALARAGRSVMVLERSRYESVRVGETLPPDIREPLSELGVWDRFERDGHAPSPGIASAWGHADLYDNDFVFNPYGHGWHIDRRRFDATLADAADEAGVDVQRAAAETLRSRLCGRLAARSENGYGAGSPPRTAVSQRQWPVSRSGAAGRSQAGRLRPLGGRRGILRGRRPRVRPRSPHPDRDRRRRLVVRGTAARRPARRRVHDRRRPAAARP